MFPMVSLALFSLGVMLSFVLPQRGDGWLWVLLLLANALALGVARYFCWARGFQAAVLLACGLVGLVYGVGRTQFALNRQWQGERESVALRVTVSGLPERDAWGRTRFVAQAVTDDGRKFHLQFQDYNENRIWQVGETWRMKASVRAAIGTRNLVGFDRESWALANGIDGIANVPKNAEKIAEPKIFQFYFNRLREKIVQHWQTQAVDFPRGVALMQALSVGYRGGLRDEDWAAFRPLGLNHLISISGLHITMVGVLVIGLMNKILIHFPISVQSPRILSLLMGGMCALIYTGLAGFEVPALRSLLMLLVFSWAWANKRDWGVWRVWWTAMAVVLIFQPAAVLAVGFWLSFGLVGGMLWALAARKSIVRETRWHKKIYFIKQVVIAQWAATLLGGVAGIYLFGGLPVFSPLVNAVAIPVFSWVLVPVALLASVLPSEVAHYAAMLGEWVMQILLWLGQKLPEMPFVHAPLSLFLLAVLSILWLLLPNGSRMKPLAWCGVFLFVLYRPPMFSGSLKVTVFDVGQGLAILLQTPTQNILYDVATPISPLWQNLQALGVTRIDALIVSHHDNDHDGGLQKVPQHIEIKKIYAGQPEFYPNVQPCNAGLNWRVDSVDFQMLTPNMPPTSSDNDQSCVLRVVSGSNAMLLMGDLSERGEKQLLQQYGNQLLSEILVLGHHGSKSSSSMAFLRAVEPRLAVASSGYANAYKHPSAEVRKRLAILNIPLARTDWQGGWTIEFDGENFQAAPVVQRKYWWQKKPFYLDKSGAKS